MEDINIENTRSPLQRYSVISDKNPREIVMLRGRGCVWRKCRFCDYHFDCSSDESANYELNKNELCKVSGIYNRLEVINSGSFIDLDENTVQCIIDTCLKKNIDEVYFESHWIHRNEIAAFKDRFAKENINIKIKIGVETFDSLFRECYLNKGLDTDSPTEIAKYADSICLLQGLPGQTKESMLFDIKTGLKYFERVCVNIMTENSTAIKPDPRVIEIFKKNIYPFYVDNPRVDILFHNTDFGVGGIK